MAKYCPHCVLPQERTAAGTADDGLFGRLFPHLPPVTLDHARDLALGEPGGVMDAHHIDDAAQDNPRIAAGWAFFGQILAHDMTRDRAPLQTVEALDGLRNYRRPRLDLEAVYGDGPLAQVYFYDNDDGDKLLLGLNDRGQPNDLPRNRQGIAIIGDARNDTYLFIAQLHVALLKLHNRLVDEVRVQGVAPADVFEVAQRLARWHYQWVVVHDYLPLHLGRPLLDELLTEGPRLFNPAQPFVPVEFAAAAFRFGHAQVRTRYDLNAQVQQIPLFPELVGQRPIPAAHVPEWPRFFQFPNMPAPQPSKRIDATYTTGLMQLPRQLTGELAQPEHAALAYRDLQRGASLSLPSGEAVAAHMGLRPLTRDELGLPTTVCADGTPLSYYVQREAMVHNAGAFLGPVGGRIIGEVLLGLLKADPTSYLAVEPNWTPTLPHAGATFGLADLLLAVSNEEKGGTQ
jgi:hypothetical protein